MSGVGHYGNVTQYSTSYHTEEIRSNMVVVKNGRRIESVFSNRVKISRRGGDCCFCWRICPMAGLLCLSALISLSSLSCISGRIMTYSNTSGGIPITVFEDIPSGRSLGPPVPPDFKGFLLLSEPRDGCSSMQLAPHPSFDMGDDSTYNKLVVLVERSNPYTKVKCTFEEKVLNAKKARGTCVGVKDIVLLVHE